MLRWMNCWLSGLVAADMVGLLFTSMSYSVAALLESNLRGSTCQSHACVCVCVCVQANVSVVWANTINASCNIQEVIKSLIVVYHHNLHMALFRHCLALQMGKDACMCIFSPQKLPTKRFLDNCFFFFFF